MTASLPTILHANADEVVRSSVRAWLHDAGWQVWEAATGADALRRAADQPDLVLLAAELPDVATPELCRRLKTDPGTAAIPVIQFSPTPAPDPAAGLMGDADGCLSMPVDRAELTATMRAFLRLRRLLQAVHTQQDHAEAAGRVQADRIEQLEREVQRLEAAAAPPVAVTAQLYGAAPLADSAPAAFQEFVQEYGRLMEQALEQQEYRVSHNVSESLQLLSERLGFLAAGPRDVVALHSAALKCRGHLAAGRLQAFAQEGRLLVLELMGHLVSYYRRHAAGRRPPAAAELPGSASEGQR